MGKAREITEFGRAVRKYRIDAGVRLKEHAEFLGISVSFLSAVEVGNKKITQAVIEGSVEFFKQFNINASDLANKAKYSTRQYRLDWGNFTISDKRLVENFATKLPKMSETEKEVIWGYLKDE